MEKCTFVGSPTGYKGWLFYNPATKKILGGMMMMLQISQITLLIFLLTHQKPQMCQLHILILPVLYCAGPPGSRIYWIPWNSMDVYRIL